MWQDRDKICQLENKIPALFFFFCPFFHQCFSGYVPVRVVNLCHVLGSRPHRCGRLPHRVSVSQQKKPPHNSWTAQTHIIKTFTHSHITHIHNSTLIHAGSFLTYAASLCILSQATIRPGPRQRKTQMSVRMGKGYREAKSSILLICSLGFKKSTSRVIWLL